MFAGGDTGRLRPRLEELGIEHIGLAALDEADGLHHAAAPMLHIEHEP